MLRTRRDKLVSLRVQEQGALSLLMLLAFGLGCTPVWSWDFWWHLKTGLVILARGVVPHFDWFTYGASGRAWIDLQWLFEITIAALFSLGGLDLLVVFAGVLFMAAIFLGWQASGRTTPLWLRLAIWTLVIVCMDCRVSLRPELFTFIFLAAWLLIIGNLSRHPRALWLLPLIQLLWVNSHGLFVLGLVVLAALLGDQWCQRYIRIFDRGGWIDKNALLPAVLAVVLVCFLNPYFLDGALFPLELHKKFATDQAFYGLEVPELQALRGFLGMPALTNPTIVTEIALFLITAISFWVAGKEKGINALGLLLFAGFTYLAWVGFRNSAVFALVAGVVACWNFGAGPAMASVSGRGNDRIAVNKTQFPAAGLVTAALIVLIVMVYSGAWAKVAMVPKKVGLGEQKGRFPHRACQFAGRPGFPKLAFLPWHDAAVYIFHNGPEYKVFMDGRLEVNPRESIERHNQALYEMAQGNPDWAEPVRGAGGEFPLVILDKYETLPALAGILRIKEWVPVYSDEISAVFVREETAKHLNLPPLNRGMVLGALPPS